MSASSYGIITEGAYDAVVLSTIVRRLNPGGTFIRALDCNGKVGLMKRFSGLLRTFEYLVESGPVDMAIVIRDADGKDPNEVESQMRSIIYEQSYPFRMGVRSTQCVMPWMHGSCRISTQSTRLVRPEADNVLPRH
jgi:hypothetical protein